MVYLDTSCLVKLYYPEPDSQKVASCVAARPICFSPLHELELSNALYLKQFHKSATLSQIQAAIRLLEADVKVGVLVRALSN